MKRAIGVLEIASVPTGIAVADAVAKAADVELVQAGPICPGKYLVLLAGDVGAVRAAVRTGADVAASQLTDELVLPNVHPGLFPALAGTMVPVEYRALGVLESFSCPSIIVAADAAAKAAQVELIELRLARGLGGKCFVTLTGEVGAVRAALQAAEGAIAAGGFLSGTVVLPAPHHSVWRHIM